MRNLLNLLDMADTEIRRRARIRVYQLVSRLASLKGNETVPTEDVIDLAQALKYIMEDIFTPDSLRGEQ